MVKCQKARLRLLTKGNTIDRAANLFLFLIDYRLIDNMVYCNHFHQLKVEID